MEKRMVFENEIAIAVVQSAQCLLADAQSALDLIATIGYYDRCQRVAIHKSAVTEDFFRLSSGLAGEVLQKFSTYAMKLAIIGDFSGYTSKPLHDFIFECNSGNAIFFVPTEQEAIARLSAAR